MTKYFKNMEIEFFQAPYWTAQYFLREVYAQSDLVNSCLLLGLISLPDVPINLASVA